MSILSLPELALLFIFLFSFYVTGTDTSTYRTGITSTINHMRLYYEHIDNLIFSNVNKLF